MEDEGIEAEDRTDGEGPPEPTRSTYDLQWLGVDEEREAEGGFRVFRLSEQSGSRERIREAIREAVVHHHLHEQKIADYLQGFGFTQASEQVRRELPTDHKTRMGNFGEVLASESLVQRFGYWMPVLKLRYRDHPNLPMRGEDVVAFKLDQSDSISVVGVAEAKALSRFRSATVREAHDRLLETLRPAPATLMFISEVLYDRGGERETRLARQLTLILTQPIPREHWIYLLTGNRPGDPFGALGETESISALTCLNLHIDGLAEFVGEIFESAHLPGEEAR